MHDIIRSSILIQKNVYNYVSKTNPKAKHTTQTHRTYTHTIPTFKPPFFELKNTNYNIMKMPIHNAGPTYPKQHTVETPFKRVIIICNKNSIV